MTRLGPGSVFGGGPTTMGEGDLQSSLKVVSDTDLEVSVWGRGLAAESLW
jgi:hypothetical protein